MLSEPRAILFETQLEWWPPEKQGRFRVTDDLVRGLYNKLFEVEYDEFCYKNVDLQSNEPSLSSKYDGGRVSRCQFSQNSISIEEAKAGIELSAFAQGVRAVLGAFSAVCTDSGAGVPPILMQRCRIHCLSQPNEAGTSLDLLTTRVADVLGKIGPFERPPLFFGVRFRFPPVEIEAEGEEPTNHNNFCVVRFETYSEDLSQVWMEVAASHFFETAVDMSEAEGLDQIEARLRESYYFLTDKCKAFLDQFDVSSDDKQTGGDQ